MQHFVQFQPVPGEGSLKERADDTGCGRLARVLAEDFRGRRGTILRTVTRAVALTQKIQGRHSYAVELVLIVRLLRGAHCQDDLSGKQQERHMPTLNKLEIPPILNPIVP